MFRAERWRVPSAERIIIQVGGEDADAYDAVDLPEEDFNYGKFIREEFGSAPNPAGVEAVCQIAAIVLTVLFVVIYFYVAH